MKPCQNKTRRISVLVVDDDPDTADSMADVLRLSGFAPRVARCGADALRLAEESAPDAVLLDIGLPGMTGWEVARHLRHAGSPSLLVAVSGYSRDEDRRRSAEVGINLHLVKPVDPRELVCVLRRHVSTVLPNGAAVHSTGCEKADPTPEHAATEGSVMWGAEQMMAWVAAEYGEPQISYVDGRFWATIPPKPDQATAGCGSGPVNALYDLYCELVPSRFRRPVRGLPLEEWEVRRRAARDAVGARD